MKIIISQNLNSNIRNVMRQCGYFENYDRHSQEYSYIRNLSNNHYPRFHIYADQAKDGFVINLHIDQKQMSYDGVNAHSGEYDSEVVLNEGERIRQILQRKVVVPVASSNVEEGKEKSFFGKLFG